MANTQFTDTQKQGLSIWACRLICGNINQLSRTRRYSERTRLTRGLVAIHKKHKIFFNLILFQKFQQQRQVGSILSLTVDKDRTLRHAVITLGTLWCSLTNTVTPDMLTHAMPANTIPTNTIPTNTMPSKISSTGNGGQR